jgi:hypothetical protein
MDSPPRRSIPPAPASPKFRAKGLLFLGAREYYARNLPGGCDALRAHLTPSQVEFFDQSFLSGGWYDVMPVLSISAAAARAAGKSMTRVIRDTAEWVAKRDLRGIYRFVLAVASVEMVVARLPDLSLRYFDFGRAEGKMIGEKVFESNRYGIPAPLADWLATATSGFVPVALTSAGAKNIHLRTSHHEPDGQAHGVALVRTRFEVRWE